MIPPPLGAGDALFLDLDGTLARIEATPQAVGFDSARAHLLERLEAALDGALAILTGRSLEDVSRILGERPARVAAVHGLVRRTGEGAVVRIAPSARMDEARVQLRALADSQPGLLLEDKGLSLALHYRLVANGRAMIDEAVDGIAARTGLSRQDGDMVAELRTPGPHKGDALRAFLSEPPFAGRRPIAVGDDLTDEDAFRAASEAGGFGVLVGPERATAARYRLDGVEQVLDWLAALLDPPARGGREASA